MTPVKSLCEVIYAHVLGIRTWMYLGTERQYSVNNKVPLASPHLMCQTHSRGLLSFYSYYINVYLQPSVSLSLNRDINTYNELHMK